MTVFGLWEMASLRPVGECATDAQLIASRYLIGDMPPDGLLGFETANELLSVRSYTIGLLSNLYRRGGQHHPREAMWWILREVYRGPVLLRAILKWNRNRYFEDRGPARVAATRHFGELSTVVLANCHGAMPSDAQSIAVRNTAMRRCRLGELLECRHATIDYADGNEVTTRTISDIELRSRWPWWSYWLIAAPSFISVDAFCHLRKERRTFAANRIVGVRNVHASVQAGNRLLRLSRYIP